MLNSPIDEIKNKLDILDVIREYVTLEKAGSNYRALCPFHSEKSPSFFVSPSRQIWRCFGGCNDGGDMFKFIMRIEGVEFADALRILAKKAGVKLQKQDPEKESKKKRLSDICDLSALFFEKQLQNSLKGKKVREYLQKRGFKDSSIKLWRIGYAPMAKDSLSRFLIGEGYTSKELFEAGVSVGKGNSCFDRFRGRLMFPISNISGQVVGFGGRVVFENDERAKYMNSPSTPLYDKSTILYGMDKAKVGIRRDKFAVMVEGYTDVILSHQEGYANTVSSSGTALTSFQLQILRRYTEDLFTAFDMDFAGGSATKKGVDLARKAGFDVKVVIMPEKMDPADLILSDPKKWEDKIKNASSVMEFYFENALSLYDKNDPKGKRKIAEQLFPEIKMIENSIERSHYVSKLADILGVSEESVLEEMSRVKTEKQVSEKEPQSKIKSKRSMLEERAASICIKNRAVLSEMKEEDISLLGEFAPLISNLYTGVSEEKLSDKEKSALDYLSVIPDQTDSEDVVKELESCVKEIKKMNIKNKLIEIEEKIKQLDETQTEEEDRLIKEAQNYSKKLQNI